MEADNNKIQRIIEICKLYYEKGMTQLQIAKNFKISRALVGMELARAKQMGIVHIEIRSPYYDNEVLLEKLRKQYNIRDGIIIPACKGDYYKQVLIDHTSKYISKMIGQSKHIGIGWSIILDEITKNIDAEIPGAQRTISPLIGNLDTIHKGFHTNELVRSLSNHISAEGMFIYAPVFPLSAQEQSLYLNTENYSQLLQEWKKLDLAIVTISQFPSVPDLGTAFRYGDNIVHKGIIGDIISYSFNKDGKFIYGDNDYAIRIPLEALKNVMRVLAICQKINSEAVRGALSTGLITHLVIDESIARLIV